METCSLPIPLQFNAHFLHLSNLAASGDSLQRHIDEVKRQLKALEEKNTTLGKDLKDQSIELEK